MNKASILKAMAVTTLTTVAFCPSTAATRKALQGETIAVRASYAESGCGMNYLNDGQSANTSPYWSAYRGRDAFGQLEYIEYAWATRCQITRSTIYWKASGDSIAYPTEAFFMVWDGHEWQRADDVNAPNGSGVSTNSSLSLETNRLRVYMRSEVACGIRECSVMGFEGEGCEAAILTPSATEYVIEEGEQVTLSAELSLPVNAEEEPNWYWLDEQGEVISSDPTLIVAASDRYTLCYERSCGTVSMVCFNVYVDGVYNPELGYRWPSYTPTLDYDFRTEYPNLPAPTKGPLPENVNVAKRVNGEWWSVAVGPNANPLITEESMRLLAKKMDEDFAYFRDEMGWPPDKRARNGYYSQVYGYGSGLSFDAGTPNTATGGWQSATNYNGSSWPMVFLSYYPIYCFEPSCTYAMSDRIFQQNACVHEGIHATFADLEGCKNSAWFQEAGNTWLQGEAEVRKTGVEPESMGYLSAGNMIAPFLPIECYSGWLLDDSFGGPSAEGVNMYSGGQQICTWRNLLGGVQYGELFPHFASEILGKGSIPWIWRYCRSRVLQGMAEGTTENGVKIPGLGGKQMRHLIVEYRARQAMIDVGAWSKACEALIDDNWLVSIRQDWEPYWKAVDVWRATPYAKMTAIANADSTGWYRPEWRTTPGWSGANQVPLHTSGRAGDKVSVTFHAFGTNMVCQLCFRTAAGRIIYGEPFSGKKDHDVEVSMLMPEAPANGVVMAVITNTDYIYQGEATRKAHFNYHLRMGDNVWQPASPYLKWYKWSETIKDSSFDYTGIEEMAAAADEAVDAFTMTLSKNVVAAGGHLWITMSGVDRWEVPVQICSASGAVVHQQGFLRNGHLDVPASLRPGMYVVRAFCGKRQASAKLIIK
ncbi:MAG: T9SS type A sorting domain-containing protein [Bacteroidales bacterium]|nr:T9SS type A sorting domain-containing protein [Bacteroidales bacterium]